MKHGEAYKLMMYRNEMTGRIEWIWNSRDGVTPFIVSDPEAGESVGLNAGMKHVEWFRDVAARYFVPPIGSRVFVDANANGDPKLVSVDAALQKWFAEKAPGIKL